MGFLNVGSQAAMRVSMKLNRSKSDQDNGTGMPNAKTHLKSAAFTLPEVMLGMVSMSVMIVSLYSGISSGFGMVNLARQNLRATHVALEKMETMRMYS